MTIGLGLTRHGPEWVHLKFAGGYFQQNGYYGEFCRVADDPNDVGGYVFESIDGSGISVYPHASSCGTASRIETRGRGSFLIGGNGTDANENVLGNKFTWNHTGYVRLGENNSGSLRISDENALPYGEGKRDVEINCKYLCLDKSQTVNSIYGNGQTYARNNGVTVTVGVHGGDCRYKMPVKMAVGATICYDANGNISTRTNYGWDVAKIGSGTMALETSVQKTLAVNEGAVSVAADEVEVPTLTMAAGTSLLVEYGGTLLFIAGTGRIHVYGDGDGTMMIFR